MPSDASRLDAQIRWKTDAWKDPAAVAGYAQRVEDAGATLLKNRVEVRIFPRYVTGSDVLDVGIGTGRASIPLARAGYRVTGTDSSQAMLDKCRELAGDVPLNLRTGDVAQLPFENASFDTVMALNTFAHFPHWQDILLEWKRVVRPGGRMIFDVFSLDHDIAFARAAGRDERYAIDELGPVGVGAYHLRLRAEELAAFASAHGLRIRALIPYSVLCGKGTIHRFMSGAVQGYAWDRQLTWAGADARLLDLLLFLEEELVSKLTTVASWRYMVVFDAIADPQHNAAWLANNAAYNDALAAGLNADVLERFGGVDMSRIRAGLKQLFEYEPNRYIAAHLLLANLAWNWRIRLRDFLSDEDAAALEEVYHRGALDRIALAMIRSLPAAPQVSEPLTYANVNLADALAYRMMNRVLEKGVNAFE
jgi:SAM-dependent methyltransferase